MPKVRTIHGTILPHHPPLYPIGYPRPCASVRSIDPTAGVVKSYLPWLISYFQEHYPIYRNTGHQNIPPSNRVHPTTMQPKPHAEKLPSVACRQPPPPRARTLCPEEISSTKPDYPTTRSPVIVVTSRLPQPSVSPVPRDENVQATSFLWHPRDRYPRYYRLHSGYSDNTGSPSVRTENAGRLLPDHPQSIRPNAIVYTSNSVCHNFPPSWHHHPNLPPRRWDRSVRRSAAVRSGASDRLPSRPPRFPTLSPLPIS